MDPDRLTGLGCKTLRAGGLQPGDFSSSHMEALSPPNSPLWFSPSTESAIVRTFDWTPLGVVPDNSQWFQALGMDFRHCSDLERISDLEVVMKRSACTADALHTESCDFSVPKRKMARLDSPDNVSP